MWCRLKIEEYQLREIITCLYEASMREIDAASRLRELGVTNIPLFFNEAWRLGINIGVCYDVHKKGLFRTTPDLIKPQLNAISRGDYAVNIWIENFKEANFLRAGLFPKIRLEKNKDLAFYFEENDPLSLAAMESISKNLG